MSDIRAELQEVFRAVFGDDTLVLKDEMTADDIEGWDSMMNINLMIAIEKRLGIKFAAAEIAGMKAEGQNLGGLIALVSKKAR
jgi:acyl carrier protein